MSNRETAIRLMENIPDEKLSFVVAFLENLQEEAEDDAFCERLYQDYLQSPDKDEFVPLEEVLRKMAVNHDVSD